MLSKSASIAWALFVAIAIGGCATKPQVPLKAETKKSIRNIAIVETPEPERYVMAPGQLPAGYMLYMFGAIGGAVLGGIEASRVEAASNSFTSAVVPFRPNVQATFQSVVESGLKEKGYRVARIAAPPKDAEGKGYDLAKLDGDYDAFVIADLSGGYGVDGRVTAPKLVGSVSVVGKSGAKTHFAQTYVYAPRKMRDWVHIVPEARYSLTSPEATYKNGQLAAEGLRTGAAKIAEQVLAQF